MIVGANTAESHPVLATRVKRAHKLNHQKLIVSDLRKNEIMPMLDIYSKYGSFPEDDDPKKEKIFIFPY